MRGRFDVTEHLRPGAANALAIRVEKPASPGAAKQHTLAHAGQNGGVLGADNPSFHASIGWDWLPTIRGRNVGLWNDVRLVVGWPVTIDPYLHFIRLRLARGGETVSENFYWRGTEPGNYRALRTLPRVSAEAATRVERRGDRWVLSTELENPSATPALAVRVVAVRAETGDRILPVHYSDNFVALMSGEKRMIRTELLTPDARGEEPRIVVEGYNIATGGD